MKTMHRLLFSDARDLKDLSSESVDLVVTSPPYPMIQMWNDLFGHLSSDAKTALENGDGNAAFEAMHVELDKVWKELFRVLKPGSFACINIGDATRTICDRFQLYPNHARIISSFRSIGFDSLPVILWRKQTNAPNKFMGSGMLPAGAYITLEHEYILIFRKGSKREFKTNSAKEERMASSFFWEERNKWFSDIWDFKGANQWLTSRESRSRSAAYPLELPYRLITMYSLYGDTVLDPFLGTGTTALAAIACGRNSIGIEIDKSFSNLIQEQELAFLPIANELLSDRISAHEAFSADHFKTKDEIKYVNGHHGFPVVTKQEVGITLYKVSTIELLEDSQVLGTYEPVGKLVNAEDFRKEKSAIVSAGSSQLALSL